MKTVLTSINPPHTNSIFDLRKKIEWRTKPMPTGKHYCYETKKCFGRGAVIGEYTVWRVNRYENINHIPELVMALGCVPIEFLDAYSKGRPLYAHFIVSPKRYDQPRALSEFTGLRKTKFGYEPIKIATPPQSWRYVQAHPTEKGGEKE